MEAKGGGVSNDTQENQVRPDFLTSVLCNASFLTKMGPIMPS